MNQYTRVIKDIIDKTHWNEIVWNNCEAEYSVGQKNYTLQFREYILKSHSKHWYEILICKNREIVLTINENVVPREHLVTLSTFLNVLDVKAKEFFEAFDTMIDSD